MPASRQWLKLMARNFTSQTQIVLGYSGYEPDQRMATQTGGF